MNRRVDQYYCNCSIPWPYVGSKGQRCFRFGKGSKAERSVAAVDLYHAWHRSFAFFFFILPVQNKWVHILSVFFPIQRQLISVADDESLVCYMRAVPRLAHDSPFQGSSGCVTDCGLAWSRRPAQTSCYINGGDDGNSELNWKVFRYGQTPFRSKS